MSTIADGPDTSLMRKAYARWAPIYDLVYDGLTASARKDAVEAALACGNNILEAGVGTGLSLGDYPKSAHVIGFDISEHMLRRAAGKVEKQKLDHVRLLTVMDACRLGFPDSTFDAVVAQFLITLVPHPELALDEFMRVLRPGGEIILANHFGVSDGPIARAEEAVAPAVRKLGWSSAFKTRRIEEWAEKHAATALVEVRPAFPMGFFKIVRLRKIA
ncbi:class I SAM-dependent methyltransferase [Pseudochelatococcus contaminans]|uniref:Phosphatidylethanolamine/phosphatidyl-N-methylethanolamine N-methyltransferase n=1 Tax=Pseudochelatococcus contaminans TaxID=1538103 RepID=A0A7W6EE02_9HYPH|nr:class I SAM-dependent methyltransferase [Pseudochelatococcus contaminans]MBB3807951.1 phosphatidylethanolamine/phosphatidyl-N-methylethanolamine N-methyltransferase [Pseudochelatococcus contaminans]